jgi:hypothetical protein
LGHEGADLLGKTVAGRLQSLDFGQGGAPRLVQRHQLIHLLLATRSAAGQPLFDGLGLFPDVFDVKHPPIIGTVRLRASFGVGPRKADGRRVAGGESAETPGLGCTRRRDRVRSKPQKAERAGVPLTLSRPGIIFIPCLMAEHG